MKEAKHVVIIGGGIGGLGTACLLGKAGYKVTILEKNHQVGGRANLVEKNGYKFDIGPSWYLMPDVFEHFFSLLDEKVEDHLKLHKLSPSYRVIFPEDPDFPQLDMFSDLEKDLSTIEKLEPGVSEKFKKYINISGKQYDLAKRLFMYRNYNSPLDFLQKDFILEGVKMNPLQTMENYLNKWFKDDRLKKVLEYTLVFLGSEPRKTPALYNIMNYIDFAMGVYYPEGGIYKIIEALKKIAFKHSVNIITNQPVTKILTDGKKATGVEADGVFYQADIVVSNADMWFTETKLLDKKHQTYPDKFWKKQVMGPSAFILYLGLKSKLPNVEHHTIRFAKNWQDNFDAIFDKPALPKDPSYYVCVPTKTDKTISPPDTDIMFVLVPLAADLDLTEENKGMFRDKVISMIKKDLNLPDLEKDITYEGQYWQDNFSQDYNAYKGTALGLAHTLKQTILRPKNTSKKVKNLYYVGAGTNPGIGMPICLISAELAYKRIENIKHPNPLKKLK